ncbi:O-methyltransferase-domain-containing protein [Suillus placidus]|uniref:O-methyltransferase-domain-containing protein n=1 Tax=Suillus placidus TaxID=48579 RepID=A0A9P7CV35_9AGAM|nr:O-methyltransferase-domain-containing protein [Suillus placidus]
MRDFNEPEAKLDALLDTINSSARQAIAEYKKIGHGSPRAIRLLEGAYHQLSSILAPPQHAVMNFVFNYNWACTNVALRARIADVLDEQPEGLSVDKLAEAVNLDEIKTARVLRAPTLMGCFKEVERDVFANNRLSLILKSENNTAWFARVLSRHVSKCAGVVYESMIEEEFSRSHEIDKSPRDFVFRKEGLKGKAWKILNSTDDETRNEFHRGMFSLSELHGASAVLYHYPWDDVSSVVDIGCSVGSFPTPLAKMFPHLRITNQDLPEVIVQAKTPWEENAPEVLLDGRVEFIPINFLEDVPAVGKDVYYLRNIIHNWPDVDATKIFHNIRKAMGPNSRVLIHDCVMVQTFQESGVATDELTIAPEPMLPNFGAGSHRTYQMDLIMWFTLNSKERTLDELKTIGATVSLILTQVYDLVETMVVEFRIAEI